MRYLSIIILAAFLVQGCSNENTVGPDLDQTLVAAKSWVEATDVVTLDKAVTVVHQIDGKTGGLVEYDLKVGNVNVFGKLSVPENSFEGTRELSVVFSNRTTTQSFGPSPLEFNAPLTLDLEYKGVNLNGLNPEEVDFYYITSNGEFHKAEYSSIEVDLSQGLLRVSGAKIYHFSRYGWAK